MKNLKSSVHQSIQSQQAKMLQLCCSGRLYFMSTEIWKPVVGFENYQVSNYSRIRSVDRLTFYYLYKMFKFLKNMARALVNKEKAAKKSANKGVEEKKEEKPKYKVYDTVEKDGKIEIVGEQKDSAGAAKKPSLKEHLESENGRVVQRGYTDGQGNFLVTENEVDGEMKCYPLHEAAKLWEKRFAYVKFENDVVIINEK